MTTATTTTPTGAATTTATGAAVREEARQAYRDSVAAGAPLNGSTLGERFGRSARWGRERIAETRAGTRPAPPPSLPPSERHAATGRRDDDSADSGEGGEGGEGAAAAATGTADTAAVPVPVAARFVAWLGFVFGSVMSVAANVLHTWLPAADQPPGWTPGIAPQVGAAVWPIGLLLSVEVLSRVRWAPGLWWALARYGGAGTVAVGAAVISYGHLHDVLTAWDYGPLGAAVGPLVLDGLMTVSGFALLAMSHRAEQQAEQQEETTHEESTASVTQIVTETVTGSGTGSGTSAGGGDE